MRLLCVFGLVFFVSLGFAGAISSTFSKADASSLQRILAAQTANPQPHSIFFLASALTRLNSNAIDEKAKNSMCSAAESLLSQGTASSNAAQISMAVRGMGVLKCPLDKSSVVEKLKTAALGLRLPEIYVRMMYTCTLFPSTHRRSNQKRPTGVTHKE
jgi:hypothetical protein